MSMEFTETHFAGKPVDFIGDSGPLRAVEDFDIDTEYSSYQKLTIPPEGEPIWRDWEREQAERAVKKARKLGAGTLANVS